MGNGTPDRDPDLEARLARIEKAIDTLAWWLVQAQTGFSERDARGISDILHPPEEAGG